MLLKRAPLLLALLLCIALLVLLAASLPRLTYSTATFTLGDTAAQQTVPTPNANPDLDEQAVELPLLIRGALLLSAAGLLLFYLLATPEMRARLRRQIIGGISLCLTLYVVIRYVLPALIPPAQQAALTGTTGTGSDAVPAPTLLVYGTSTLVAALLVGSAWLLILAVKRRRDPLDDVAQEARAALANLEAGRDVRETIVRCYLEMSRAVSTARNVRRQPEITPREFELQLADAGLPQHATRRLTRLFEQVRYGGRRAGESEIREAHDCLTDILAACEARP